MQEKGYHGWSYENIAATVNLRKATLHYYFPKKEILVRELLQEAQGQMRSYFKTLEQQEKAPEKQLKGVVDFFAAVLDQPDCFCLCGMLAADAVTVALPIKEDLILFFAELEGLIAKIIEAGNRQQSWKTRLYPSFEAKSMIASFEGMLLLARLNGDKAHFTEAAEHYLARVIGN